jgi:Putative prokaryotic signal transducing protein
MSRCERNADVRIRWSALPAFPTLVAFVAELVLPSSPEHLGAETDGGRTELVEVIYAKDAVEAEMIQGLLENGGIPSVLRALGINGPQLGIGLLMRNPQRVMVHADQAQKARALLAQTLVADEKGASTEFANAGGLEALGGRRPRGYGLLGAYARIYLWSSVAIAIAFGAFLLLRAA